MTLEVTNGTRVYSIDNIEHLDGNCAFFPKGTPEYMTIPVWSSRSRTVTRRLRDYGPGYPVIIQEQLADPECGIWYLAIVEGAGEWIHLAQTLRIPRMEALLPSEDAAKRIGARFGAEARRGEIDDAGQERSGYLVRLPYLWPGGEGANGVFRCITRLSQEDRGRCWFRRPQDDSWKRFM